MRETVILAAAALLILIMALFFGSGHEVSFFINQT
jgi:hypothetical protein